MVKILREQNKDKILLINVGVFYIAIEKDIEMHMFSKKHL